MEISNYIASNLYANYNLEFSNRIFRFLAIGLPKEEKYNYLGVIKFYEGDIFAALTNFIRQLEISPSFPSAYANLAFVSSFYADESSKQFVIDQIEKIFPGNKKLLKLKLSLLLSLNRQKATEEIHSMYIDQWVHKAIINPAKKPILFFHIPKCAGTSLTDTLYNYYYKSQEFCIPNYFEIDLLRYCIEEIPDVFPFLSSRHISLNEFDISLSDFYSITCFRDPLKRTISAFRQTRNGNKNGRFFKVIPKYGSHWNTGKVISFKDWLDTAPNEEINHQLSTFSNKMQVSDFISTVGEIDYLMFLENFKFDHESLKQILGIKTVENNNSNKKLNQSSKKIKISPEEIGYAKEKLEMEISAIMHLRGMKKQ